VVRFQRDLADYVGTAISLASVLGVVVYVGRRLAYVGRRRRAVPRVQ
jgi:hypothetical protein